MSNKGEGTPRNKGVGTWVPKWGGVEGMLIGAKGACKGNQRGGVLNSKYV